MAPDMPRPDQLDAAVLDPALPPDRIRELARAAAAAGVTGTPTMHLDGRPVDITTLTPDSLTTKIQEAASS